MPIKAKRVDPARAAQVARGQLSGGEKTGKNYFYYEGVKKREMKERDGDCTSSSSNESSRAGSPKPGVREPATSSSASTTAKSGAAKKATANETDSDEELLAAARERTRRFLYLDSDKQYEPVPYHNERADAYARYREAQQRQASIVETAPSASTAALTAAPTVDAIPFSHRAHSPQSDPEPAVTSSAANVADAHDAHDEASATVSPTRPTPFDVASTTEPHRADFYKLLNLIGQDVEREWATRSAATTTTRPTEPATASTNGATARATAPAKATTYRPPAQTFAELQDDALQQLYEKWSADHDGDDTAVFIAADHAAEAFTRAAAESAARSRTLDVFDLAPPMPGAPPGLEELVLTNAMMLSGHRGTSSARAIASEAQGQLNRFLASVGWIERLVRDARFIASTGSFLHRHHKVFMRYLATAATTAPSSSLAEHDHQEFAVYQQFGSQFSDLLLRLLSEKVEGFDETEFVEALYETPVTARTQFAAVGVSQDRFAEASRGPQNVLSYPAWRIVLAMSSFESFFDWMMDYVREEYNMSVLDEEAPVVAVGGARGVRALLRSTYGDTATATTTTSASSADHRPDTADKRADSPLALASASRPLHASPDVDANAEVSAGLAGAPATRTPLTSHLAPVRLSPSPPPAALHPLPRPDSSPPFASTAGSMPPTTSLPNKFFPTPPASADGRLKQANQKARLGQRLAPLTAKTLSTDTTTADTTTTTTTQARKKSSTQSDAVAPARSKSGAKRGASQTKRTASSAGSVNPGPASRRSSAVGSSAGSASTSPSKGASAKSVTATAPARTAAGLAGTKPRPTARAPSKTNTSGGTKPKLKKTAPQ